MLKNVKVEFRGGAELAAKLRALPAAVSGPVLIQAVTEAAEPMRQGMARRAPYEPGAPDLRDSMTITPTGRIGNVLGGRSRAATATEHTVAVGPAKFAFYGRFQEYGTVHHAAQPFMRPAFDSEGPESLKLLADRLWALIRSAAERG